MVVLKKYFKSEIIQEFYNSGPVFTKGLSQVLDLNVQYNCIKFKPKNWLSSFINTSPGANFTNKLNSVLGLNLA